MGRRMVGAGLTLALTMAVGVTGLGASTPDAVDAAPVASSQLDEAAAMGLALDSRQPVEVSRLTTERLRVVADPTTRAFRAEVSALPVRVRDPLGGWRAVDTTLVPQADGSVAPRAAASDMVFSGGGGAALARIADGADWMAWSWPAVLPAPVLSGSTATYPNVLPDVDLVVEAGVEGFSEFVVVRSAKAAANPALARLRFGLSSSGLTIAEEDGGIVARAAGGKPVFHGPAPRMWDSAGVPAGRVSAEGTRSRTAIMDLAVSGSTMTVTPDPALLRDPNVVFPLVLDPTASKHRTYWTMVWNNGQKFPNHATEHARVGYDGWTDGKISRVFYRFDSGLFADKHILSATLQHAQIHSPEHDCSDGSYGPGVKLYRTGSISSSTSWSSQPSWLQYVSTSTETHGHELYCPGFTTVEWDAEAAVEAAANNGYASLTLGLRSADETDRNGWRKYDNTSTYPVLTVSYNTKPSTPSGSMADPQVVCSTSSTNPSIINDTTPRLRATMHDSDGASAENQAHYEIYEGGTKVWDKLESAGVPNGQPQDETVSPALLNGHTYKWRIRAEEYIAESWDYSPWWYPNTSSSTSHYCYFTIDTTTPGQPQVVGDIYPKFNGDEAVAYGGVGQVGTFTVTADPATAASVVSYKYQLNNGAWITKPTTAGAPQDIFVAPDHLGVNMLHVVSVTGAGTPSVANDYDFNVARGAAPVGVWELNETAGSTAADSSGGGRTATLSGGAVWSPTMGRLGGSLDLDGTDDGAATAAGVVNTSSSFTVSAWVRLDTATNERTVLAQSGSATSGFELGWSTGTWAFARANSNVSSPTVTKATSAIKGAAKVWTHLAGVYDAQAQQLRLYVNGVLDTTSGQRTFTTPWATTGPLDIGRVKLGATYAEYLDGRVDEIRVWNRVVAPEELALIAVHMEDPATGAMRPALVGQWALNESGVTTTAADSTPYSRHGSVVGGTGATWTSDEDRGNYLNLNGNSGVYVQSSGRSIDPNGSFIIIARVRPATPNDIGVVVAQPGVAESAYELRLDGDDFFRFGRTAADVSGTAPVLVSSTSALPISVDDPTRYETDWVHLAAVYDAPAALMYLYVDGVLQNGGGTPFASNGWTPSGGLAIGLGEDNNTAISGFEGGYSDVRVYTGVMSAGDIITDVGA